MPWIQAQGDLFETPYAPRSEASRAGARAAQPTAASQAGRLLALYRAKGPQTDHEARKALRLPLSTINARRASLIKRGLVKACGTKPGPWGVPNTRYEAI